MLLFALFGCANPADAPPAFSDAARYGLLHFDDLNVEGAEADALAAPLLSLEAQIQSELEMDSEVSADRALALEPLAAEDVAGIPHPDRDPAAALPPVALARTSIFPLEAHVQIALRTDLSPMEPNSPEIYTRSFTDGEDCFATAECVFLRTENDVLKQNAIMEIRYPLFKDYRWVDLGDGRHAMAARSWMPESATGEDGGTTIWQSFTLEIFVPQADDTTVRMMALWSETEFSISISEDAVESTSLVGIDDIFQAHDEWLVENPAR